MKADLVSSFYYKQEGGRTLNGVISKAAFRLNKNGELSFELVINTDYGVVKKVETFSSTNSKGVHLYRTSAAKLVHKLLLVTGAQTLDQVVGELVFCRIDEAEELVSISSLNGATKIGF